MSYLRLSLDLAIKEPIPQELEDALPEIKQGIRKLKSFASKINEGEDNEENTTKAAFHVCRHDTGEPCEEEISI